MQPSVIADIRRSMRPTLAKKIVRGVKRRTIGNSDIHLYSRLLPKTEKELWCAPDAPNHPGYMITKIAAKAGLSIRPTRSSKSVAALAWRDKTVCPTFSADQIPLMNGSCTDIRKQTIEKRFAKTFGYDSAVDPTTFHGLAIKKSDENALHRGEVIKCPIDCIDCGDVYERLVDSSIDDKYFEEMRICVIGNEIPFLYVKCNPLAHRFGNWIITCSLVEDAGIFLTTDEQKKVLQFSRSIGLDCGEMDALRDKSSGQLYIIDVSKNPFGPPSHLGIVSKIRVVNIAAKSFGRAAGI